MLQNSIETKMQEFEILLNDLALQKAKLELERGYRLTKEDLMAFIAELIKGDVEDKDFQKTVIDHLVSQVFIDDGYTVIYFNIRGGKGIETVSFEETRKALDEVLVVQTQSAPARHEPPRVQTRWLSLFVGGYAGMVVMTEDFVGMAFADTIFSGGIRFFMGIKELARPSYL